MESSSLFRLLEGTGIPAAREVFLTAQNPPYLILRDGDTDIVAANSRAVLKKRKVTVELYAAALQVSSAERAVEAVLDAWTTYSKSRTFDDAQQLCVTYYQFYLI